MTQLASDDFAGTGALDAAWVGCDNDGTTMSRSSGQAISDVVFADAAYRYNGVTWPADQWGQVILGPMSAGLGVGYGVTLRNDPASSLSDPTHRTHYRIVVSTGGYELLKFVANTSTQLEISTGTTFANGDTLYAQIVGTQVSYKKNGTPFGAPPTDSAIATGQVGIGHSSVTNGGDGIASWTGGDMNSGPGAGADSLEIPVDDIIKPVSVTLSIQESG